jgi:hypothetical protein
LFVCLLCDILIIVVDAAAEAHGLENLIANSAEKSPSSESPSSVPSVEVPPSSEVTGWIIMIEGFFLLLIWAFLFYCLISASKNRKEEESEKK